MGRDKHEKNRTEGSQAIGKARKHHGPPKGEAWVWWTQEMMESPAYRALSGNGLKILSRLLIEHMAHGGTQNGQLICTYQNFVEYGVRQPSIAAAIKEAEYFGFITVNRGKSYRGEHEPNIYRLTWIGDSQGSPATNQWKGIEKPHIDLFKRKKAEDAASKKKRKQAKAPARALNVVPIKNALP